MLLRSFYRFCTIKQLSPYKVLNVQQNASQQQIKTKYYELAQKYHPDHDPSFTQKFKTINQAYQILKDPEKRRELDGLITKGVNTTHYSSYAGTRHSYGYGYKPNKQTAEQEQLRRRHAKFQANNKPNHHTSYSAASSFDLHGRKNQYNNYEENAKKHIRMKQQQNLIKNVLMGGVLLFAFFGVVELVFKVYEFNNKGHKYDAQILAMQKRRNQK